MNFPAGRRYTIDYRRRVLRWTSDTGTPDATVVLQTRSSEGRCLVALPQAPGRWSALARRRFWRGRAGALRVGRRPYRAHAARRRAIVNTAGGAVRAERGLLPELKLGGLRLRNLPAVRIPIERGAAIDGDGLLPLHLFAQVSFAPLRHDDGEAAMTRR